MLEEGRGHSYEGYDEVEGEDVLMSMDARQFHQVEEEHRQGDDQGLTHLHTIDTRKDIDSIGTEHSQHPHIQKIEEICRIKAT